MNGLRWFHRDVGGGGAKQPWQLQTTLGFWLPEEQYVVRDGADRVSLVQSLAPPKVPLEQAASVSQPIWTAATPAYGNRPSLNLDGVDDWMQADALASQFAGEDMPYTLVAAISFSRTKRECLYSFTASGNRPYDQFRSETDGELIGFRLDDATGTIDARSPVGQAATAVFSVTFYGQTVTILVNGASIGADALPYDVGVCTFTRFNIGVLRRASLDQHLAGSVAAVGLYGSALSDAERQIPEQWMLRRFDL